MNNVAAAPKTIARIPRPVRQQVYRLYDVLNNLFLTDSPFLMVFYKEEWTPIQMDHVMDTEAVGLAGFAETEWKYSRTTDESIPLFYAVNTTDVLKYMNIETTESNGWLITPKV